MTGLNFINSKKFNFISFHRYCYRERKIHRLERNIFPSLYSVRIKNNARIERQKKDYVRGTNYPRTVSIVHLRCFRRPEMSARSHLREDHSIDASPENSGLWLQRHRAVLRELTKRRETECILSSPRPCDSIAHHDDSTLIRVNVSSCFFTQTGTLFLLSSYILLFFF